MCIFEKIKQNKNENKTKKKMKNNTPRYFGWCRSKRLKTTWNRTEKEDGPVLE